MERFYELVRLISIICSCQFLVWWHSPYDSCSQDFPTLPKGPVPSPDWLDWRDYWLEPSDEKLLGWSRAALAVETTWVFPS